MRGARGTITAMSAALLCMGSAACGSSSTQNSVAAVQTAAAKPTASASPADRAAAGCSNLPGIEVIAVDGTTTVDGDFAVTGYVQKSVCGPGVPDDVEYQNTGAHRSFALPTNVKVELLGTTPTDQHTATLAVLENLLRASFATPSVQATSDSGSMLWSRRFEIHLGSDGQIVGITAMYQP